MSGSRDIERTLVSTLSRHPSLNLLLYLTSCGALGEVSECGCLAPLLRELALLLLQRELQPPTLHCVSQSLSVVGVGCSHAVAQLTPNLSPLKLA